MDDPWDDVAAAADWLLELERRSRADVVHLNGYCHAALPWRSQTVVVGHSCVRSWWRAVHGGNPPAVWERYSQEVRRGLQAAAVVVAPSETMLSALREHYGPLPRACVVHNGRTRRPSLVSKEALILSAGRLWDPAKNIPALCAAAARVPWPIAIAGDPGADIRQLDPDARVRHLGRLAPGDVQHWLARASIYAAPARYEPFGLSVLEAASAGCALVLGDIPSLRELWEDAALYVEPDDHVALARALSLLIDDADRRMRLMDRARRRAAMFTPSRMADGYCDLYAELLGERRPVLSLGTI
jgi:glycosyltransferase involved in cell wall biosynthesis